VAPQTVPLEKRYRFALLLDAYGELLTEKQRYFMRRYFEGDFSFGEIAAEARVSRQAVYDAVKHGAAALERYEAALGLVRSRPTGPPADVAGAALHLRLLAERVASNSMNGDTRWIAREINAIAAGLESPPPGPAASPAKNDAPPDAGRSRRSSGEKEISRAAATKRAAPAPAPPRPKPRWILGEPPEVD
jgi:predicted DNA-binding protein YlxM (UPF0122 family)